MCVCTVYIPIHTLKHDIFITEFLYNLKTKVKCGVLLTSLLERGNNKAVNILWTNEKQPAEQQSTPTKSQEAVNFLRWLYALSAPANVACLSVSESPLWLWPAGCWGHGEGGRELETSPLTAPVCGGGCQAVEQVTHQHDCKTLTIMTFFCCSSCNSLTSFQCSLCRFLPLPWLSHHSVFHPDSVLTSVLEATGCSGKALQHVVYVEHVVVSISITHRHRGDLSITLTSPSGTVSQLLANR